MGKVELMSQVDIDKINLDFYGGRDPREIPAYTFRDASKYLDIPLATLRSWILGRSYPIKSGTRRFKSIFYLPDKNRHLLSFTNLIEAHVLNALRKEHRIDLKKVRRALLYLQDLFGF